jgi:hypothetical protein
MKTTDPGQDKKSGSIQNVALEALGVRPLSAEQSSAIRVKERREMAPPLDLVV